MKKTIASILVLIFITVAFAGCNATESDGLVGLWQGEIEVWDEHFVTTRIEFFDNGIAIAAHDIPGMRGHAFGWQQGEDVLYIEDLTEAEYMLDDMEMQAAPFEISGNQLTIEDNSTWLGSLSGVYTRQNAQSIDDTSNHPLLGTWELPPEMRLNARGIWEIETLTFSPDGTILAAQISESWYRQEQNFLWMTRGNQLIQIENGTVRVADFHIDEGRLYLSIDSDEFVLTRGH